jgi:hypothetical protein
MNILKILLVLIILFIFLPVLALGYFGFVPGLSDLMGANKPKDLGVKVTQEDITKTSQKIGVGLEQLPDTTSVTDSIKYEGKKDLTVTLDSLETTALANSRHWKYAPIDISQIRINPDGTAEISGVINKNAIFNYAAAVGITSSDIAKANDALKTIPTNPSFYIKGKVEITNNQVSLLDVNQVQIGRFSVPEGIIKNNQQYLGAAANQRMSTIPGFFAKSLSLENGQVKFEGTVPDKEMVVE